MTSPKYPYLYTGAFCVYYGRDDETGETLMLITKRGKHFTGSSEGHGTAGGFLEVKNREQPAIAAVRELEEEIPMPDKSPALSGISPDRLVLIGSGVDYDYKSNEPGLIGVVWHAHACELTAAEVKTLKNYVTKFHSDADFADAVRTASNQELGDIFLLPPVEVAHNIQSGVMKFAYAHEGNIVQRVALKLQDNPTATVSHLII
jgi:hypothetical protein